MVLENSHRDHEVDKGIENAFFLFVPLSHLLSGFLLFSVVLLLSDFRPLLANEDNVSSAENEKQRGLSWVAGQKVNASHIAALEAHHVDWIVQTPFGWQETHQSPRVALATSGGIYWGETDVGLSETGRLAREKGIKVLLKPHIWLNRASEGMWRSDIEMQTDADWDTWFEDYRLFILHYAKLAEENKFEVLCVGTELYKTAVMKEDKWRSIIAEIRTIYSGKLIYAANWYREYEEIAFWDDLDYIGIQGYFPLAETENPSVQELVSGWQPHLKKIEAIHKKFDKPVIFTEIGYRSQTNAAIKPWEWPSSNQQASLEDLETQVRCYEAFFQGAWQKEWCAGAYFWKWFPRLTNKDAYHGFTPQNKPALRVLGKYYGEE